MSYGELNDWYDKMDERRGAHRASVARAVELPPVTMEEDDFFAGRETATVEGPKQWTLLADQLREWWLHIGKQDATLVAEKYQEYGNTALLEVGHQLADLWGHKVSDGDAQMLGVYFFMVGKMARWKTALLKGEQPSRDTLDDLAVYATMARNIMEHGNWPMGVDA